MITWSQLQLQDACSPIIEELIFFHDFAIVILVIIIRLVSVNIALILFNKFIHSRVMERQILECVWTIVPALILIEVAIPSLILLYIIDETRDRVLTIKVVGHQWYWRYEYSDFWLNNSPLEFDSYMLKEVSRDVIRLLDTDNRVCVPIETSIQILIRSADVLHSWTVPAAGIKADACPGRLNQLKFISHRPGLFYGQCSEICGANHRFIPICMEVVSPSSFINWIETIE
jgi:cytochrome c oxidase subunit 2